MGQHQCFIAFCWEQVVVCAFCIVSELLWLSVTFFLCCLYRDLGLGFSFGSNKLGAGLGWQSDFFVLRCNVQQDPRTIVFLPLVD
jgi:hypothetical protein